MSTFADSYLGQLRQFVGNQLLLVPGTAIVIENSAEEILLELRSDFGIWGLPSGSAEKGEKIEAVAIREVFEETSLIISDLKPFGYSSDPLFQTITYPNGDQCQAFTLLFYTKSFTGELIMSHESTALSWFSLDNLPDLLPTMTNNLKAFERFKSTGEFQLI